MTIQNSYSTKRPFVTITIQVNHKLLRALAVLITLKMTNTSQVHICYSHSLNTYLYVFSFKKNQKTTEDQSNCYNFIGGILEQSFTLTISREKLTNWAFENARFSPRRHLVVRQRVPTIQGLRLERTGFCNGGNKPVLLSWEYFFAMCPTEEHSDSLKDSNRSTVIKR